MPDSDRINRAFWIEAFEDYLGLEAGNSPHTVDNYLRDIRRLATYLVSRKAADPSAVRGRAMAFFTGAFNLGFTLSLILFGLIAQWWGYPAVFIMVGILVYLAVGILGPRRN